MWGSRSLCRSVCLSDPRVCRFTIIISTEYHYFTVRISLMTFKCLTRAHPSSPHPVFHWGGSELLESNWRLPIPPGCKSISLHCGPSVSLVCLRGNKSIPLRRSFGEYLCIYFLLLPQNCDKKVYHSISLFPGAVWRNQHPHQTATLLPLLQLTR